MKDYDLLTPLHLCANKGRYSLAQFLISRGHDVNCYDRWGKTPLYYAINQKHYKMVKLLLKHEAILGLEPMDLSIYINTKI